MHVIIFMLFVLVNSIACQNSTDKSNQSVAERRYYSNHPPSAEVPIPVSIVYEDDSITSKIIQPEVSENSRQEPDSKVEDMSLTNETKKEEKTNTNMGKLDDIPAQPKARALSPFQIPVAVVYDSTTSRNIQNPQPANASKTNSSRTKYKRLRRRKQQNKTINNTDSPIVSKTEPAKLKIENVDNNKLKIKNIDSDRSQLRKPEVVKPQPNSYQTMVEPITKIVPRKRERDPVVPIINSENFVYSHSGNFHYSYEGGDGTKAYSEGKLMRSADDVLAGEAVSGGFSYTDKDGKNFSLSYTADERGYRPIGAHLPTPPPIPPAIARALAYLATATTPEPVTKPSVTKRPL